MQPGKDMAALTRTSSLDMEEGIIEGGESSSELRKSDASVSSTKAAVPVKKRTGSAKIRCSPAQDTYRPTGGYMYFYEGLAFPYPYDAITLNELQKMVLKEIQAEKENGVSEEEQQAVYIGQLTKISKAIRSHYKSFNFNQDQEKIEQMVEKVEKKFSMYTGELQSTFVRNVHALLIFGTIKNDSRNGYVKIHPSMSLEEIVAAKQSQETSDDVSCCFDSSASSITHNHRIGLKEQLQEDRGMYVLKTKHDEEVKINYGEIMKNLIRVCYSC